MLTQSIFWLAYIGTGVLLVLLAWLGSRRRRLSPKQIAAGGRPAACGSCGYELTGLPDGVTCPECGSDLMLVGRMSPQFHRWTKVPLTARLIVWTVVVTAFATALLLVALEQVLPWRQQSHTVASWSIEVPLASDGAVRSPTYAPVVVTVDSWVTRDSQRINGFFLPIDSARWSGASIRARSYALPSQSSGGADLNAIVCVITGEGLTYLTPDAQLQPTRVTATEAQASAPAAKTSAVHKGLLESIRQSGYDGSRGPAEALAMQLTPEVEAFVRLGAYGFRREAGDWHFGGYQVLSAAPAAPASIPLILTASFWPIVWALGLPFVLRKRPMTVRR